MIATHSDGDGNDVQILETVTTLTGVQPTGNTIGTYTSENGTNSVIRETTTNITGLQPSGKLIGVYSNEAASTQNIRETITTMVDNLDGTYTYTNETGATTTIDGGGGNTSVITNTVQTGNLIANHDNGDGLVVPINETVTTLVDNGDGTFTYTSEDGTTTTTDGPSSVTNTIGGQLIANHNNGLGVITPIRETVTTMVDNGNGTYTYTAENGVQTTVIALDDQTITSPCSAFSFSTAANGNITMSVNYPQCGGGVASGCPCYQTCNTGEDILIRQP